MTLDQRTLTVKQKRNTSNWQTQHEMDISAERAITDGLNSLVFPVEDSDIEKPQDAFQNLPPEIISEIFRRGLASKTVFNSLPTTSSLLEQSYEWRDWALNVSSVCARWRQIALGDPKLWTTVAMHRAGDTWTLPMSLVEEWISRTAGLRFTVSLSWDSEVNTVDENLASLVRFLCTKCTRWRSLILQLPYQIVSLFNYEANVTLNLTFFRLQLTNQTSFDTYWKTGDAVIRARDVGIVGTCPMPKWGSFIWTDLVALTLRCVSASEILPVLAECKKLLILDLSLMPTEPTDFDHLPSNIIILPHLISLTLLFFTVTDVKIFLLFIRLRKLRRLKMCAFQISGRPQMDLTTLKQTLGPRCRGTLCAITFQNLSFPMDELMTFLLNHRNLSELHFANDYDLHEMAAEEEPWLDALLDRLTRTIPEIDDSSPLAFLPRLMHFTYVGPKAFTWTAIADIIEAHINPLVCEGASIAMRPLLKFTILPLRELKQTQGYIDKDTLIRFLKLPECRMKIRFDEDLIYASLEHHGLDKPPRPFFHSHKSRGFERIMSANA